MIKRLPLVALLLVCVAGVTHTQEKLNPTGTWKWTVQTMNGEARPQTLKLNLVDGKLTGTLLGRNNEEMPIENAVYQNGDLSFTVTREFNGEKFSSKYTAKLSGDAMKGQMEFNRGGETRTREWDAKRETAGSGT